MNYFITSYSKYQIPAYTTHNNFLSEILMHNVKSILGGQVAFFGTINGIVHVIMYSYYFLTIINPEYKKAWWKKYLTTLQLVMYWFGFILWDKYK